jgi:hypothetical protein
VSGRWSTCRGDPGNGQGIMMGRNQPDLRAPGAIVGRR